MAIIDLTQSGAANQDSIQSLVDAVGDIFRSRVDPDNPIRSVLFPAGREELVQREINRTLPVEDEARALTREVREQAAFDTALPAEEAGQIAATERRGEGAQAEADIATAGVDVASARRDMDFLRALNTELPASEAAVIEAEVNRSRGAQATLTQAQSEWDEETIQSLRDRGWTPTDEALNEELAKLNERARVAAERLGHQWTSQMMGELATDYMSATPTERQFMMSDFLGQSGWIQRNLQRERFDFEREMTTLRNAFANSGGSVEDVKAVFDFKQDIFGAMDGTVEQIREAAEAGEQDRLRGLAERFNDQAETMFLLDPGTFVNQAAAVENIFGRTKGLEFSLGDLEDSLSGQIMQDATLLSQRGMREGDLESQRSELVEIYGEEQGSKIHAATIDLANQLDEQFYENIRQSAAVEAGSRSRGEVLGNLDEEVAALENQFQQQLDAGDFQNASRTEIQLWIKRLTKGLMGVSLAAGASAETFRPTTGMPGID